MNKKTSKIQKEYSGSAQFDSLQMLTVSFPIKADFRTTLIDFL